MNLIACCVLVFFCCVIRLISSNFSEYNYEKMNRYGLGRRLIPDYRRLNPGMDFGFGDEHPKPLPLPAKKPYVKSPYSAIYQGSRKPGDYKVFSKKFDYAPLNQNGQRYFCEARLNCIINYVAVRTEGGVPIILRGGVGYSHFYVVARAYVGKKLNGNVQVYCVRHQDKEARRYQYGLLGKENEFYVMH